jgi:RHS repeat-associated protein
MVRTIWLASTDGSAKAVQGILVAALLLAPAAAWAACFGNSGCTNCQTAVCAFGEWTCHSKAAGTACTGPNACFPSGACDGTGVCTVSPVVCSPIANGANMCTLPGGTCTSSCNNGFFLSGSTCLVYPATAGINAPSTATTGTTGLTASVAQPQSYFTYAWSISAGGSITAGASSSTVTFSALVAGTVTLTLTVTNVNQTSTATATWTVNVYAPPNSTISVQNPLTTGAPTTASVPSQSGASYSWTLTNGTFSTAGSSSSSVTFTPGSPGTPLTLQLTVTNGNHQSSTSSLMSIAVYPVPLSAISTSSASGYVTAGQSGSASVPVQSSDSYSWTISGGTLASSPSGQTVSFTAGTGSTMTLTCTVTNPAGGSAGTSTSSTTINIVPPPDVTLTVPANVTAGVPFAASVPAQGGTFSWAFTPASGTSYSISSGNGMNSVTVVPTLASGVNPGSMTVAVTVTNAALTSTSSVVQTVNIYALPVATFSIPPNLTANQAGYSASVPVQTGASYRWSISGGTITVGSSPHSITFTPGASGTVSLTATVTNAAGAVATWTATSTIWAPPSCAISVPQYATTNAAGLSASVPSISGTSVSWTITGGAISAGASTSNPTFSVGAGASAMLSCSATNTAGTNVTGTATVTIVPAPTSVVTAPATITAGNTLTVGVTAQAGMTYAWSFSGTSTSVTATILSGVGTSSITVSAALGSGSSGTLVVNCTVTNQAGSSAVGTSSITVNAAPGPQITTSKSVATVGTSGLTASVFAQLGATYAWTISSGSAITAGNNTKSITFTVQSLAGKVTLNCVVTAPGTGASLPGSATVNVVSPPMTPVVSGATLVTAGTSNWQASARTNPGMTYNWWVTPAAAASLNSASGAFSSDGLTNTITYSVASAAVGTSFTINCAEINAATTVSVAGTLSVSALAPPVSPTSMTYLAQVTTGVDGWTASVAANPNMSYVWTISGGTISNVNTASGSAITFKATAAGGGAVTLSCAELNSAGTASAPYVAFASVIAAPTQPIITGLAPKVTSGATGLTASVTAHAGMIYWWTISGGSVNNGQFAGTTANGANSITFQVTGPVGTTLTLTAVEKNAAGTQSAAALATALIADVPVPPKIAVAGVVKPNQLGLIATTVARPNMSYAWSIESTSTSVGASITGSSTTSTTATVTFSSGGNGTIILTCLETNGAGASTSGYSAPIVVGMPMVADAAAPVQPQPPTWGSVGSLPAQPSVEGGAAGYHVPIEVPPGRHGMQPTLSLDYNSRNGNGTLGVGWALAGLSSIYRCPNILDTDGVSRPVMHDSGDRFCMDGHRLVLEQGSTGYGTAGSTYRTEIEQYERITLPYGWFWGSLFEVQHKSGRVSIYRTQGQPRPGFAQFPNHDPDTWYLDSEYDPQGNCMSYQYTTGSWETTTMAPYGDAEVLLSGITYTGNWNTSLPVTSATCTQEASTRSIQFSYSPRADRRTTYRYGVASPMTMLLTSITTTVSALSTAVPARAGSDGQTARIYNLNYSASNSTTRSLLRSIQLCADPTCTQALPATTFSYRETAPYYVSEQPKFYVPSTPGAAPQLQTLNGDWQLYPMPDFDGDGAAELFLTYVPTNTNYVYSSQGCAASIDGTSFAEDGRFQGSPFSYTIYNNGKALLVGSCSNYLCFAPLVTTPASASAAQCTASIGTPIQTSYSLSQYQSQLPQPTSLAPLSSLSMSDLNGDGVADLLGYSDYNGGTYFIVPGDPGSFRHLDSWSSNSSLLQQASNLFSSSLVARLPQDFNGDGTADQLYDTTFTGGESQISFLPRQGPYAALQTLSSLGGLGSTGTFDNTRRWIDVNGDGLPDIYDRGMIYINMGGPNGTPIFKASAITNDTLSRVQDSIVMDVDGDGIPELLVPDTRVRDWCYNTGFKLRGGDPASFCGDEFDIAPGSTYRNFDRSIFSWRAWKIVEQPDGTYQLVASAATNFWAPIHVSINTQDITGDGLADATFVVNNVMPNGAGATPNGHYLASFPLGTWVNWNTSGAPDLLTSVTVGTGATSSWTHRPLVLSALGQQLVGPLGNTTSAAAAMFPGLPFAPPAPLPTDPMGGCTLPSGVQFYSRLGDGSNSNGYSYVTSSMWTVSEFHADNGVGGVNRTCYRYADAMLSDWGRGFQGFRSVTTEEQFASDPSEYCVTNGTPACGTSSSPNNHTTRTDFFQEFPLTGRPKAVTVSATATGNKISTTQYWYHQTPNPDAPGSWIVFASGQIETDYDPANDATLSNKTSIMEIDLASGEASARCGELDNATPVQGSATLSAIATYESNVLNPADKANWIVGQISQKQTRSGFWSGTNPLTSPPFASPCSGVSGSLYSAEGKIAMCSVSPPGCANLAPTAMIRQQKMDYTWVPKGTYGYRQLGSTAVSIVPGDATQTIVTNPSSFVVQSTEVHAYDQFGNMSSKQVSGNDVCQGPSPCGVNETYQTTLTYEPTGYFLASKTGYYPANKTGPAGTRVATFDFLQETGAAHCTREIDFNPAFGTQIGVSPQTCRSYDALGRLSEVTRSDQASTLMQYIQWSRCSGGCAMKAQTYQAGAPTATIYFDVLNRAVADGVEGVDGNEIIARTVYNARGQKVRTHPPAESTLTAGQWDGSFASAYPTSYIFDVLGRVSSKTVLRNSTIFATGAASLTTTYQFSVSALGIRTDISVPKAIAVGGALAMSRTYDRVGNLVETTETAATPTIHTVKAKYFYDPQGQVIAILDSNAAQFGYQIAAHYDSLGRKTSVVDPDKGTATYTWDGFGRLRTQTDGNGNVLSFVYDPDGRQLSRMANGYTDQWTYDAATGILTAVMGADGYRKTLAFDNFLRPTSTTVDVPGSANWAAHEFVMQYAYDGNHARLKETAYPRGEFVATNYDLQRGFLVGESQLDVNGNRVTTYRNVTAMSPRGAVTGQALGNGVLEVAIYDDSTGVAQLVGASVSSPAPPSWPSAVHHCADLPGTLVRCTEYAYDQFVNLSQQNKHFYPIAGNSVQTTSPQVTTTESYQYDDLQRLTSELRAYTNLTPSSSLTETYSYDDTGNILSKSDFTSGLYHYGNASRNVGKAGPHAVLSVDNGGSYTYDSNGNMLTGGGRTVQYDGFDRPISITMGGVTTTFAYAPDGDRYLQRTTGPGGINRTIYYVGKAYERVDWDQKPSEERTYIGGSVVVEQQDGQARQVNYLHLDRLGSTDAVTSSNGGEVTSDTHGYDAFGGPRGRDLQPSGSLLHPGGVYGTATNHGFTGHEHLDETYLIHMNGRVYDYRLGRFLSVDPIISNPASSQSINPYSYIGNNPLSGVDPTGYAQCDDPQLCNPSPTFTTDPSLHNRTGNGEPAVAQSVKNAGSATNGAKGAGPDITSVEPAGVNSPSQTGSKSSGGQPETTINQSDIDRLQHDLPKPDVLVPATIETNKLAIALRQKVEQNLHKAGDTKEEALIAKSEKVFKVAPAESCNSSQCNIPPLKEAEIVLHRHIVVRPMTQEYGDVADAKAKTVRNEMPVGEDWRPIIQATVPNYTETPRGAMKVLEFNKYGGAQGYFVREVGPSAEFIGHPTIWDPR